MPREIIRLGDLKRMLADPKFHDDMEVWCFSVCMTADDDEDVLHASVEVENSVQVRDGRVVLWANGYSDEDIAKSEAEEAKYEEAEADDEETVEP